MYVGDQRWPGIIVRINSGCACMSAINCDCVCMSGDQRLLQKYVGDQRWPHMCPVLWWLQTLFMF